MEEKFISTVYLVTSNSPPKCLHALPLELIKSPANTDKKIHSSQTTNNCGYFLVQQVISRHKQTLFMICRIHK